MLAVGIFATDENLAWAYGNENDALSSGVQFGVQLASACVIASWTVVTSGALFFGLRALGFIRVDKFEEEAGLDASEHNGAAYPEEAAAIASKSLFGNAGSNSEGSVWKSRTDLEVKTDDV